MPIKLTTKYVKPFLEEKGFGLLGEYVRDRKKLSIKCPGGHVFYQSWDKIKQKGIKKILKYVK